MTHTRIRRNPNRNPRWTSNLPMPSGYFELALRVFGGAPDADAALREGTGVTSEIPGAEITLGQQLRQVRNINRREAPGWGLLLGNRFEAATHGALGFAALSAPTIGDGLAVIERFSHVRSPYFRVTSRGDAGKFILEAEERVPLADEERIPLFETLISSLQCLVQAMLGRPMHEADFYFAWPTPEYAHRYGKYFHGSLNFHADRCRVAIPLTWLYLACPTADPAMYETSMRTLETLRRRLEGADYLVARVEQMIAASGLRPPTLVQMAKKLHMSTRTVMRHLRRAGTTYQHLVDEHRRGQAQTLLKTRDIDIAEVGYTLGYQDPANFGRACRRWFGMAPSRYRVQLLDR